MFKAICLSAAIATLAAAAPSQAQAPARTLDAFVLEANRVPMNPTAALRPSVRRLMNEGSNAMSAVVGEARTARAAGRAAPACPPEKIQVNPRQLLGYLNGIPQSRRVGMSVRDGFRAWLADRYPCPR